MKIFKNRLFKLFTVIMTVIMIIASMPLSTFAAVASDVPENMRDNPILRALEYTGYDVSAQKADGTLYQTGNFGSRVPESILSGIGYGTALSGLETVSDSSTKTGLAPNLARFRQSGLCCAAFVTYYICNYLPNIEGVDTQFITDAIKATGWNPQAVETWQKAMDNLVAQGKIEKIGTSTSNVDRNKLTIGDIITYGNASDSGVHAAIYAGTYKGEDYTIHVGNSRGPEISLSRWMNDPVNGSKQSTPNAYYHIPQDLFEQEGYIEINKKDTDGNKLAGAYFTATNTSTNKKYVIGPTDRSGYAISADPIPFGTYKVVESVFPTDYRNYGTSEWTVTIDKNTPNATVSISAVNEKIPGSCKIVKSSEDGKVSGISFTLSGNGVNKTVTTNNNGEIQIDNLKPGSYTVTEHTADKYEPQETRTVTVVSGGVATVTFNNVLKRGDLVVTKTAEDGLHEGIRFRLYGTSLSGLAVDEYAVVDAEGKAYFNDVLIGSGYVLEEVNTPSRYVMPDTQTANILWNDVTSNYFENTLKKFKVDAFKLDAENGGGEEIAVALSLDSDELVEQLGSPFGEHSGDATLEGAVYGLYCNGNLIGTYTTDKNGYFVTDYFPCAVNGKQATYYIQEITPSEGYLLDTTKYYIDCMAENYTIELNTEYHVVYEQVKKGKIAIIKHADDGSTQIETPEENAEFQVYLKSAGGFENAKETEREILVTDKNGFADSKYLPYGVYTVKQTKGLEGKELMPAFDVFINSEGEIYRYLINNATFEALIEIVKKDVETGKIIPAAGIGFMVRDVATGEFIKQHINYPTPIDIDTYYTDVTGKLMMPEKLPFGQYEIIEVCVGHGYVLDSTPVPFKVDGTKEIVTVEKKNVAQKGTITVEKSGEIFFSAVAVQDTYQPVYSVQPLEGAVYEIKALEDIITYEGTVRYTEGQIVDTITTEKDGKATSKPLYLGKYEVKEITAPYGMVINKTPVNVELTYAGEKVEITTASASFVNERQRAVLSLEKALEKDEDFNIGLGDEILNVKFGLYAAETLTAYDGSVIPKDALIETASCEKQGNITFKTDLPIDAKVYAKEIATDDHYILSDKKYNLTFEYAGQDTDVVNIEFNNGKAVNNEIIRGYILGRKLDEDGFAIAGAQFGLFHENETEFTENTAIQVTYSNPIGYFAFLDVPYGRWLVRELKAAPAFVLNENSYAVTVSEAEETVEIEIENKFIVGSVTTTKVDKEYPENKLTGAIFEIYVDVDRNEKFDPDIDKLVGEMTETDKGIYTMQDLRYNGYFLHEKTAPKGFIKDDGYYYFEIRENGKTVTVENEAGVGFTNKPIKGELEILKTDEETEEPLEKIGFRIKDEKGNVAAEGYTDKNGIVKFTLRYGKYTYSEFDAEGYIIDTTEYPFEITEDGQKIKVTITNERIVEITSPQTGDNSNIGFWIGLGAVALGGLIACAVVLIKSKKEDDEE